MSTKRVAATALTVAVMCGLAILSGVAPASAADLFRHRYHSRGGGIDRADYGCPVQEAAVYRPRIANFHEPLCYAARPYGLGTHLYDISSDLRRGRDADFGTGY